jgi:hypothetical protein
LDLFVKVNVMKNKIYQRVEAQFGPDVTFEVTPVPEACSRAATSARFGELQARLVRDVLEETLNPVLRSHLLHAANEAAALAWTTSYPLLVIPTLLAEKVQAARFRAVRQTQIQRRSQEIVEAVL